jgi:hypothetical protein
LSLTVTAASAAVSACRKWKRCSRTQRSTIRHMRALTVIAAASAAVTACFIIIIKLPDQAIASTPSAPRPPPRGGRTACLKEVHVPSGEGAQGRKDRQNVMTCSVTVITAASQCCCCLQEVHGPRGEGAQGCKD